MTMLDLESALSSSSLSHTLQGHSVTNSEEATRGQKAVVANRLITIAIPLILLLATAALVAEFFYRPSSLPTFIAVGDQIAGPGFWSTRLALPLGVLIALNIGVACMRRVAIARSQARSATILLSMASAGLVLLLASSAVLGPLQPRAVAVGDPSEAGCQMYASRQDVLSGAGGEFLIRPSGESVLFPTGERWAARGGPEFSVNQYIKVSWMAEKASIRDTSGDDANSFQYRGVGTFTC